MSVEEVRVEALKKVVEESGAFVIANDTVLSIAKETGAPVEILSVVRRGENESEEEYKARLKTIGRGWRLANDPMAFKGTAPVAEEIPLTGRPETVDIATVETAKGTMVVIKFKFRSTTATLVLDRKGYEALLLRLTGAKSVDEALENDLDVIASKLGGYVHLRLRRHVREVKRKGGTVKVVEWRVTHIDWFGGSVDMQGARRLLEAVESKLSPMMPGLAAWVAALGYDPAIVETEAMPMFAARAAAGVASAAVNALKPTIHVAEFGLPGIGKTHTAMLYEVALSWRYHTEPPTVTALVGDARTGYSPLHAANGVWLDEFDAYWLVAQKDAFQQAVIALHSGMEQGEWKRSAGKGVEAKRLIPVYLAGNLYEGGVIRVRYRGKVVEERVGEEPRKVLRWIVSRIIPSKVESFDTRVAIALSVLRQDIPELVMSWTLEERLGVYATARPSVLRGLAEILARTALEALAEARRRVREAGKMFSGSEFRHQRQLPVVAAVVAALVAPVKDGRPALSEMGDKDWELVLGLARNLVKGVVVK